MNLLRCLDCCETFQSDKPMVMPYCSYCKQVRLEYSRPCSRCATGIIGPEEEDFTTTCKTCTIPKYICSTTGCNVALEQHWMKTCTECFKKQRASSTSAASSISSNASADAKQCITCSAPVAASWQSYCMPCYSSRSPSTRSAAVTTGKYNCTTPGCSATFPEQWKKLCLSCFKMNKAQAS